MIRLSLRGLWSRKLRTIFTVLAIVFGVAMIAGTYVLTDQITNGFDKIFSEGTKGTDVAITPKAAFEGQAFSYGAGMLPATMLDQVKGVDGVAEAVGITYGVGSVVIDGKVIETQGAPTIVYSTAPFRFTQSTFVEGAAPTESGTGAVNSKLAEDKGLKVGDTIGLTTGEGLKQVKLSGIFTYGQSTSIGGATMVELTLADTQDWYEYKDQYSTIAVAAAPGVTPDELASRIKATVGDGAEVLTGKQSTEKQSKAVSDMLGSLLTPFMLAFAGVALLVGAFIIFNIFSITVAQRVREFAMLRSIGASRRQVLTSVIGEAAGLGLVGGLLGIGLGIGLAKLMLMAFASIPTAGVALAPRTITVSLIVGIGVASAAALAPALQATRVPPVAALREGAALPVSWIGRHSVMVASLIAAAGAAIVIVSMAGSMSTSRHLLLLAAGAVSLFVAISMAARYIVRPLAHAIGWPIARLAGTTGRLARDNASRNPQRTASTAASLMICLAIVVLFALLAQGFKASFVTAIDKSVKAKFVVSGTNNGTIPVKALDSVRSIFGVDDAAGLFASQAQVNGDGTTTAFGISPAAFGSMWSFQWLHGGDDTLLTKLSDTSAIVEEGFADRYGLSVGKTFTAESLDGTTRAFRAIGVYRDPTLLNGFVINTTTYDGLFPDTSRDPLNIIATTSNANPGQVQADIKQTLAAFPTAKVQSRAEYTDSLKKQVNGLLTMIYALLGMSVIISIFGIFNALVLTVYERTREIGMLRAIGTSRRQMRRIVRHESVITSVIGAVMGTVIGLVFGYLMVSQLSSLGMMFSVPWAQLVTFVVLAGVVGVVAAIYPAYRASRIDILEAIHFE